MPHRRPHASPPGPQDALPPPPVVALRWEGGAQDGALHVLDQTLLPGEERRLVRTRAEDVVADIRRLAIRGAPLLGMAGAYALVLAAREILVAAQGPDAFNAALAWAAERIATARPTAINLPAAVLGALAATEPAADEPVERLAGLLREAQALEERERRACEGIAREGARVLAGRRRILTHCNAGALVTPGLGTALAPLYALHHRGEQVFVWVDETRPLLQGLRLTAYELAKAGVPHAVIGEGAAFGLMREGRIDAAIVGADRICANGDVINKVGTYGVALGCRAHGLPFFVAAPPTTFDRATPSGASVTIEERRGDLGAYLRAGTLAAATATVEPAFDVTPSGLVTGILWGTDDPGLPRGGAST